MTDRGHREPGPRDRWLLLAIFALALVFRLLYIHDISDQIFFKQLLIDQDSYDRWAMEIVGGQWLGSETFYQDPFYPYLLAIFYLIFGRNLALVYVLQSVLSSLCVFPMAGIGRRGLDDRRVGLVAAFLWAAYKLEFFFAAQIEKTSPGMALTIFSLWLLLLFRDRPRPGVAVLAGLLSGLALVFRGNYLAVYPLLVGFTLWVVFRREGRKVMVPAAVLVAAFVLLPAATAARNYAVSGEFTLTTAQAGINFYVGNYRGNRWGVGVDPPWARRVPRYEQGDFKKKGEELAGRELSAAGLSRFWFWEGFREIAADPSLSALRLGRKALLIVNRHEISDNLNIEFMAEHYSWMLRLPLPGFWLAGPLGFAGLVLALRRRKGIMLAIFILSYSATLLAFYIVARYRLPLVAPLLAFAGYAVCEAFDLAKNRAYKNLAAVIALALFFAAAGFPRYQQRRDDHTWNNIGNAYARTGRYHEAAESFQKAVAINPGLFSSWMGLGRASLLLYRHRDAVAAFQRAVTVRPDNAEAHYMHGRALELVGRQDEARAEYETASRLDPSLATDMPDEMDEGER